MLAVECKRAVETSMGNQDFQSLYSGREVLFYMMVTQKCNKNCFYCYQPESLRKGGNDMSQETLDQAIAFAAENFNQSKMKFNMFGGEPLLNYDLCKYAVESYPTLYFLITTNAQILLDSVEVREWFQANVNNLAISASIGALRAGYESNFVEHIRPVLDVVKSNRGDVHYVVEDPADPRVFGEVQEIIEYGVGRVRVSATRHHINAMNHRDEYIALFKRIADFIYFDRAKPLFGVSSWDAAFSNNIYRMHKGVELAPVPPTFCGCGYVYLAVDYKGDIYPCDYFTAFPEFIMGNVLEGMNEKCQLFEELRKWKKELYADCEGCRVCKDSDIRLCPRAMCLAENYETSGNIYAPAQLHCSFSEIEYGLFDYIAKKAVDRGLEYAGI